MNFIHLKTYALSVHSGSVLTKCINYRKMSYYFVGNITGYKIQSPYNLFNCKGFVFFQVLPEGLEPSAH